MGRFGKIRSLATWISIWLILILFWSTGFYLIRLTEHAREQALHDQLLSVAQEIAEKIQRDDASLILENSNANEPMFAWEALAELPQTLAYEQLLATLQSAMEEHYLSSLALIDGAGVVLCDVSGEQLIGEEFRRWDQDSNLIQQASNGLPRFSPFNKASRAQPGRIYLPLRNSRDQVAALLCMELPRAYYNEIRELKRRMIAVFAIVTGLLMLIGWGERQAMKRLDRMELAMEQNDRLQSLGIMAAGLAHEIRNPLQIMRVTAEELRHEVKGNSDQEDLSSDMIVEIDRLNRLIQQVLQFSRPEDSETRGPAICSVSELIENLLGMVRKNLKRRSTQLSFIPPEEELPRAAIHPDSLRQALLNVILNAGDAVGEDGRIEIALHRHKNNALRLEVSDNGRGIDPKKISRVFDPFYSDKSNGTGLGLSITRRILDRYGGRIEIESRPQCGCRVIITLPTAKE